MSLDVYHDLGLQGIEPCNMVLKLADGSSKIPLGVIKDVPVQVDKYQVPCDFVVMEVDKGQNSSLIFGRPFLATTKAKIDVAKGLMTLEICEEKVEVKSLTSMEVASCDLVKSSPTSNEFDRGPTNGDARKLSKRSLKNMCKSTPEEMRVLTSQYVGSIASVDNIGYEAREPDFSSGSSKLSSTPSSKDPG